MAVATIFLSSCGADDSAYRKFEEAVKRGDYDTAYELAVPIAESGDTEIQFSLAVLLMIRQIYSWTQAERDARALYWTRMAAVGGHVRAMRRLGDVFWNGWMSQESNLAMAECWRAAAEDPSKISICAVME